MYIAFSFSMRYIKLQLTLNSFEADLIEVKVKFLIILCYSVTRIFHTLQRYSSYCVHSIDMVYDKPSRVYSFRACL